MIGRISWRVPALLCAMIGLIMLLASNYDTEEQFLGIPMISQDEFQAYQEQGMSDAAVNIQFNSAAVALDSETRTLYIPLNVEENTQFWEQRGVLFASDIGTKLYFVEDDALTDMAIAISEGYRFHLIAKTVWGEVTSYDVVFTGLPVISLETITSEGEGITEFFTGTIVLWDPHDDVMNDYRVTQSTAEWHYRGRTTLNADKKSYRVSLKTKTGDKENNHFLDLGYDDDWIINAVVRDGTKLREPIISELWSQMQETNDCIGAMSEGRYVELVCDGVYQGVYLLQRRIDGKYLNIGADDVLIKGTGPGGEESFWSMYSPESFGENINSSEAFALTQEFYDTDMWDLYELDSWIDVELLIQLGALRDNVSANNMFYWFRKQADGYAIRMIPWDVDMSFGHYWIEGIGFALNPDMVGTEIYHRREYSVMQELYPDLDQRLAKRWMELREDVFTTESFTRIADENWNQLASGGALAREYDLWAYLYDENDTVESMKTFFENRLLFLDEYYGQWLP